MAAAEVELAAALRLRRVVQFGSRSDASGRLNRNESAKDSDDSSCDLFGDNKNCAGGYKAYSTYSDTLKWTL